MKNYIKSAHDTLAALGFTLDHGDRVLRKDRWIFAHANDPDVRLTLNYCMSELAARTVVQRAKQIVGLATSETGHADRKARIATQRRSERAAERNLREAARAAADARAAEREAELLVHSRRRQVSEVDALMRGHDVPSSASTLRGDWITPEAAADHLGVTDKEIRRAIAAESLELYQVGKRQLLKVADVRSWTRERVA